eukprot:scaffold319085_cov47-Attheya_sp.AAC.2
MEYDLARARNVDAVPVERYWTARTRSFLPRPVIRDRLPPVAYLHAGSLRNCDHEREHVLTYAAFSRATGFSNIGLKDGTTDTCLKD